MSWLVPVAHAATLTPIPLLEKIKQYILDPIILLIMAGSFVYFIYGVFVMVRDANNSTARETGQRHIFWGVIGLFISLSAVGILNLICRTIQCN